MSVKYNPENVAIVSIDGATTAIVDGETYSGRGYANVYDVIEPLAIVVSWGPGRLTGFQPETYYIVDEGVNFTGISGSNTKGAVNMGDGAIVEFLGSTFSNNSIIPRGGGLYTLGEAHINNSLFQGNKSTYGGAIWNGGSNSKTYIEGSTFTANTANTNGGAIWQDQNGAYLSVQDSIFTGNQAKSQGGVLYLAAGTADISGSTFTDNIKVNTANTDIVAYVKCKANFDNCSFEWNENTTSTTAQVLTFVTGADATITESNFFFNTATDVIKVDNGRLAMSDVTLEGNSATGITIAGSATVQLEEVSIKDTEAGYALDMEGTGVLTITDSEFAGVASNDVLVKIANGTTSVSGSKFTASDSYGGGINISGGKNTFENSWFENITRQSGAAIKQDGANAKTTFIDSLFNFNDSVLDLQNGTVTIKDSEFSENVNNINVTGGVLSLEEDSSIDGATGVEGAAISNASTVYVKGAFLDINGGSDTKSIIKNSRFISIDDTTFLANTASEGVIVNSGTASLSGNIFEENIGGAILNRGIMTINGGKFLTETDTILNEANLTLTGAITLNANLETAAGATTTVNGADFIFSGKTAITVGALTTVGTIISSATFANTGKVSFTSVDFSATAITINQSGVGNYELADGVSALNTNLTVNGTETTLVNGTGTSASSDGKLAQFVSYGDNALSLTTYDKLYVGFEGEEDATHFASLDSLQATYAGYSGSIINSAEVFYNPTWTEENLPASTTLGDGTVVELVWGFNAFSDLAYAKDILSGDGILTFEGGSVPTSDDAKDIPTVRIHNASGEGFDFANNNNLILDTYTFSSNSQIRLMGDAGTDNLAFLNVDASGSIIETCYTTKKTGDFNFTVDDSTAGTLCLVSGNNSGVAGTLNFTINDSYVEDDINPCASSDTSTELNNINIVLNDSEVTGGVWATGSSQNVIVKGNSKVRLNDSWVDTVIGAHGNIVQGWILLELNNSEVNQVIGEEVAGTYQGTSYLFIEGNADSIIHEAITNVDAIYVGDGATLLLGNVTITDSNLYNNMYYNGTIAVLDYTTATLAGTVTLAPDITMGENAALAAADDAVIILTGTSLTATIATGKDNILVFDNEAALSVTADVTGFVGFIFNGDASVDLNSQALDDKVISIDTDNVWTKGTTTIAKGITSVEGTSFTVNGLEANLGESIVNGVVLNFTRNSLILTVTAIEVGSNRTLDSALNISASNPAIITFSSTTDGSTCTFNGNTISHDQVFQGNGSDKTKVATADGKMAFANGNDVAMNNLDFGGIIYGGTEDGIDEGSNLSFLNANLGGNVFGGGRANADSDMISGEVILTLTDSTQAAGKAVYGGAYANGGNAIIESVSLTLTDVDAGTNSVYGGGAVNNGGKLEVGAVDTIIDGGVHGAVYNGANIYTAGTGSEFTAGEMSLEISGGTFSGAVGNGSTPRSGASSTQGASTLEITDGLFEGIVYGGGASFGGDATVASTTVSISGGTFNGKVYGGNVGSTGANASLTNLSYDANLTIDSSASDIYFNGNVYGGSMGTSVVGGDVNMTLTGDGSKLHFGADSFLSGASEYAYDDISYVEGTKALVFDAFTGDFNGNIQGPSFDTVTFKNGSQVNFCNAGVRQNVELVSTWNFELSDASAVMITDDASTTNVKNNFRGDTINITFADGAVVEGTDWTVYQGTANTILGWNKLGGVTIDGVAAKSAKEGSYMAWTTEDYKVYMDENQDIRLAKLA